MRTRQYLGIAYSIKNMPELDDKFIPMEAWMRAYERLARSPVAIAVEAADGRIAARRISIIADGSHQEADYRYVERMVKFLLWSAGGFRIYVCGAPEALGRRLREAYHPAGERGFDARFMRDVYEREFEVLCPALEECPAEHGAAVSIGGHLKGCRIGFDAGGSDRKVSAVVDGKAVYSEEVVWHPKTQSDPQYHFREITAAFRTAASKMPRVDAIGVSSAGVFVGNSPMVSSLFLQVPREQRPFVKSIFCSAAKEIGDGIPLAVANDGDVTALAGSMELNSGSVLGIAMGTSEAAGYVNAERKILGWLNELAFAPVDLSEQAMRDEWSGDLGVGCKYFSQDAVIKLAPRAGIVLPEDATPARKLELIQRMPHGPDDPAARIFRSIGTYLAHTIPLYSRFYPIRHLLALGRVLSGLGGNILTAECGRVLAEEYPALAEQIRVTLPDEKSRRVGQSVAAASLPE